MAGPIAVAGTDGRGADTAPLEIITTAAHELRTPLTVILGFTEMLQREWHLLKEADRDFMLRSIRDSAEVGNDLIERYLSASNGNGRSHTQETLVLASEARALVRSIAPILAEHRVEVRIPDDLRVIAEQDAFREVLSNLLVNAVKYAPEASTITVEGHGNGCYVDVVVADQGDGIDAQDHSRIFDRGFRVCGQNGNGNGAGIGLSLVRELVDELGGHISVESSPGFGTAFTFTLPRAPADVS